MVKQYKTLPVIMLYSNPLMHSLSTFYAHSKVTDIPKNECTPLSFWCAIKKKVISQFEVAAADKHLLIQVTIKI